jgi:WD40 repeat protein
LPDAPQTEKALARWTLSALRANVPDRFDEQYLNEFLNARGDARKRIFDRFAEFRSAWRDNSRWMSKVRDEDAIPKGPRERLELLAEIAPALKMRMTQKEFLKQFKEWYPRWFEISDLQVAPDGGHVVLLCKDGSLRFCDSTTLEERWTAKAHKGMGDVIRGLGQPWENDWLVWHHWKGGSASEVHAWNCQDGKEVILPRGCFSPDGKTYAALAGRAVEIREMPATNVMKQLDGHQHPVQRGVFSPGGKYLLTEDEDSVATHVILWSTQTFTPLREFDATFRYQCHGLWTPPFSPDEKKLVLTFKKSKTIETIDVETGEQRSLGPARALRGIFFSPDSRNVVLNADDHVEVLDVQTCSRIWNYTPGSLCHGGHLTLDGRHLFTSDDHSKRILDVADGRTCYKVTGGNIHGELWDSILDEAGPDLYVQSWNDGKLNIIGKDFTLIKTVDVKGAHGIDMFQRLTITGFDRKRCLMVMATGAKVAAIGIPSGEKVAERELKPIYSPRFKASCWYSHFSTIELLMEIQRGDDAAAEFAREVWPFTQEWLPARTAP